MLVVADVLGSLEEHVLEQVREARSPLHLARAADVVVDVDRCDRDGVVLVDDELESVVEHELLEGNRRRPGLRGRAGGFRVGRLGTGAVRGCRRDGFAVVHGGAGGGEEDESEERTHGRMP